MKRGLAQRFSRFENFVAKQNRRHTKTEREQTKKQKLKKLLKRKAKRLWHHMKKIPSFFGHDYSYNSDSSEDKYITIHNVDFAEMGPKRRYQAAKSLWRTLYNKANGANKVWHINSFVTTKIEFFGRQLIYINDPKKEQEYIGPKRSRYLFPLKFAYFWHFVMILLIIVTVFFEPIRQYIEDDYTHIHPYIRYYEMIVDSLFFVDIFITLKTPLVRVNRSKVEIR